MADNIIKGIYKQFYKPNNSTAGEWQPVYFKTSADQVVEASDRIFFDPSKMKINGQSFASISNNTVTKNEINLYASDIKISSTNGLNVNTILNSKLDADNGIATNFMLGDNAIYTDDGGVEWHFRAKSGVSSYDVASTSDLASYYTKTAADLKFVEKNGNAGMLSVSCLSFDGSLGDNFITAGNGEYHLPVHGAVDYFVLRGTTATESVAGSMSAEDKKRLNQLWKVWNTDENTNLVDTIEEVLEAFQNFKEGTSIVSVLNSKLDKNGGTANDLHLTSPVFELESSSGFASFYTQQTEFHLSDTGGVQTVLTDSNWASYMRQIFISNVEPATKKSGDIWIQVI